MDELITINKDIPIPQNAFSGVKKYPWKKMAVGDSFLIPKINGEHVKTIRSRANGSVQQAAKRLGLKFCTRLQADGIRVWRIE